MVRGRRSLRRKRQEQRRRSPPAQWGLHRRQRRGAGSGADPRQVGVSTHRPVRHPRTTRHPFGRRRRRLTRPPSLPGAYGALVPLGRRSRRSRLHPRKVAVRGRPIVVRAVASRSAECRGAHPAFGRRGRGGAEFSRRAAQTGASAQQPHRSAVTRAVLALCRQQTAVRSRSSPGAGRTGAGVPRPAGRRHLQWWVKWYWSDRTSGSSNSSGVLRARPRRGRTESGRADLPAGAGVRLVTVASTEVGAGSAATDSGTGNTGVVTVGSGPAAGGGRTPERCPRKSARRGSGSVRRVRTTSEPPRRDRWSVGR